MNELALFAGAGGGLLASKMLGWRTVCAVERDAYPAQVLAQRQNDGILEPFPIWSDVESFDGKPWRGIVDVVSGGFPCQDISVAGKGAGIEGERSGMWREFARIIGEVRPKYAFIENSPMLIVRGLDRVLCDLAEMGFDAKWGCLSASEVGAPHKRERIWIVATDSKIMQCDGGERYRENGESSSSESGGCCSKDYLANTLGSGSGAYSGVDNSERRASPAESKSLQLKDGEAHANNPRTSSSDVANTNGSPSKRNERTKRGEKESAVNVKSCGWSIEPNVGRVANELADQLDISNGAKP